MLGLGKEFTDTGGSLLYGGRQARHAGPCSACVAGARRPIQPDYDLPAVASGRGDVEVVGDTTDTLPPIYSLQSERYALRRGAGE